MKVSVRGGQVKGWTSSTEGQRIKKLGALLKGAAVIIMAGATIFMAYQGFLLFPMLMRKENALYIIRYLVGLSAALFVVVIVLSQLANKVCDKARAGGASPSKPEIRKRG